MCIIGKRLIWWWVKPKIKETQVKVEKIYEDAYPDYLKRMKKLHKSFEEDASKYGLENPIEIKDYETFKKPIKDEDLSKFGSGGELMKKVDAFRAEVKKIERKTKRSKKPSKPKKPKKSLNQDKEWFK